MLSSTTMIRLSAEPLAAALRIVLDETEVPDHDISFCCTGGGVAVTVAPHIPSRARMEVYQIFINVFRGARWSHRQQLVDTTKVYRESAFFFPSDETVKSARREEAVSLATPCENAECKHPLNWHTKANGCIAREGDCPCEDFEVLDKVGS